MRLRADGIVTDLRVAETLQLEVPSADGACRTVTVTLEAKSGQMARLRVQAPNDVVLRRPAQRKLTEVA